MLRHELVNAATQSPDEATTPREQSSRKRKATYSARGVASLTPEQLAKKRANDREAQRAIRERTKSQIETLEKRIQDLKSQQPYQELQSVLRQKDAIQAENDEIRRRLAAVLSLIQPIVGAQSLTGMSALYRVYQAYIYSQSTTDLAIAAHGDLQHGQSPQHIIPIDRGLYTHGQNGFGMPRPLSSNSPIIVTTPKSSNYQQPYPGSTESMSQNERQYTAYDAFGSQRNSLQRGLELNDSGERLGFSFLLESVQNGLKNKAIQAPLQEQESSPDDLSVSHKSQLDSPMPSPWSAPCRNVPPTCPLDIILLDFVRLRQRDAAEGVPRSRLVGPAYPSVSSLLNPEESRASHPLSRLIVDILSKFPNIDALPEQVAVLYIMFLIVRWQICPNQENYDRLPEWVTPRPSQLFIPHPAWIDHIPWPKMRDILVSNYQDYPFDDWFMTYTSTMSLNWPYDPSDCLLFISEDAEPTINPVFERHLMKLDNWTLGPAWAQAHPKLAHTARIKQDKKTMSVAAASGSFD